MDASIPIRSDGTHTITITQYRGLVDHVVIDTGPTNLPHEMAITRLIYHGGSHFGGFRIELLSIPFRRHHHARDRHGHDRCLGLYCQTAPFQI